MNEKYTFNKDIKEDEIKEHIGEPISILRYKANTSTKVLEKQLICTITSSEEEDIRGRIVRAQYMWFKYGFPISNGKLSYYSYDEPIEQEWIVTLDKDENEWRKIRTLTREEFKKYKELTLKAKILGER